MKTREQIGTPAFSRESCDFVVVLADTASIGVAAVAALMEDLRGRPCISHLLRKYCSKLETILVLDADNVALRQYLDTYGIGVRQVFPASASALHSLHAALLRVPNDSSSVSLLCPHALCTEISHCLASDTDALVASSAFLGESPHTFHVENTGMLREADIGSGELQAIGCSHLTDVSAFKDCVSEAIESESSSILSVYTSYAQLHPLCGIASEQALNLSHESDREKAADFFFNSRSFNSITVDRAAGVIAKSSLKTQKLEDEYQWYLHLPQCLQRFIPQPLSFEKKSDEEVATLVMEYCGYPPLSELHISGKLPCNIWQSIIRRLFEVHSCFSAHKGELDQEDIRMLYLHKTLHRVVELLRSDYYWKRLWSYASIEINGISYRNIRYFESILSEAVEQLIESASITVVHGDYCFSNILFDTASGDCKLIDPRGSVRDGKRTIYGDPRYDIAKLRHSAVGGYDYAVHGLYKLHEKGNVFTLTDNYPSYQRELNKHFDALTAEFGYDEKQIQLIEALIFLSIIPMHSDDGERQLLFYLKAVKKFNELFGGN